MDWHTNSGSSPDDHRSAVDSIISVTLLAAILLMAPQPLNGRRRSDAAVQRALPKLRCMPILGFIHVAVGGDCCRHDNIMKWRGRDPGIRRVRRDGNGTPTCDVQDARHLKHS
jgi:hypothetical protein